MKTNKQKNQNYCFIVMTGKLLGFYSTEGNTTELFAANNLFVESRAILFYCTQTKPNLHSFVHSKKKTSKTQHADISTYGLFVQRPAVYVSMEIFMQLITGNSQNLS